MDAPPFRFAYIIRSFRKRPGDHLVHLPQNMVDHGQREVNEMIKKLSLAREEPTSVTFTQSSAKEGSVMLFEYHQQYECFYKFCLIIKDYTSAIIVCGCRISRDKKTKKLF